eukprot:5253768-Ditylum_brightwellii.AAC.1
MASEGAKKLLVMTSKAMGDLPLIPIKPQYVYSMDNSVEYIYCGTSDKPDTLRLTASIHNSSVGTYS